MDLLTFLLSDFLESRRGPQNRPAEAELAGQELELVLEEAGSEEMEIFALDRYASLNRDERATLSTSVHEWFLERYTYSYVRERIAHGGNEALEQALIETYVTAASPVVELLAVNALLASSQRFELEPPNPIESLWPAIVAEREHPSRPLQELAEILFDLHLLAADGGPALRGLRALRNARSEGERGSEVREFARSLAEDIRSRAESLGGEKGRELRSLISDRDRT